MPNRRKVAATSKRTDVERLHHAREMATILVAHPLGSGEAGIQLHMKFDVQAGSTEVELTEPDAHLFKSLVIDLEPFVRNDEDAHLPSIMNIALRHLDDPELVHLIESAQHAYRVARQGLAVKIDGKVITGKQAADLWLNAAYFHRSLDKQATLGPPDSLVAKMLKTGFIDYMFEVGRLAVWVGSVLDLAEERGVIRDDPVKPVAAHPHRPATIGAIPVPHFRRPGPRRSRPRARR